MASSTDVDFKESDLKLEKKSFRALLLKLRTSTRVSFSDG